MSALVSHDSPDDQKRTRPLSGRLATATTRAILIAIVAGGLLTVALNLSQLSSSTGAPLNQSKLVAPAGGDWESGLPIRQVVVRGDETVVRMAVVQAFRQELEARLDVDDSSDRSRLALKRSFGSEKPDLRAASQPDILRAAAEDLETLSNDSRELARDPNGRWSIREIGDWRRRLVGVSHAGGSPTLLAWGGYDEIGPREWRTWIMRLSKPEK